MLGWSPVQFWDEATWFDVMAALDGWLAAHGPKKPGRNLPSREAIKELMERFPDGPR